jgi:hypothetical protein
MMTNGKDSAEVVKFLSLYTRLKDWCDDEPDAIFQLAITDKQFKDLCMQLLDAAERLHASEQRHRHLFANACLSKGDQRPHRHTRPGRRAF